MATLTSKRRNRLPASASAQPGTSGSYSHVAKAVRRKWGDRVASVGPTKGTLSKPGKRRRRRKR